MRAALALAVLAACHHAPRLRAPRPTFQVDAFVVPRDEATRELAAEQTIG